MRPLRCRTAYSLPEHPAAAARPSAFPVLRVTLHGIAQCTLRCHCPGFLRLPDGRHDPAAWLGNEISNDTGSSGCTARWPTMACLSCTWPGRRPLDRRGSIDSRCATRRWPFVSQLSASYASALLPHLCRVPQAVSTTPLYTMSSSRQICMADICHHMPILLHRVLYHKFMVQLYGIMLIAYYSIMSLTQTTEPEC